MFPLSDLPKICVFELILLVFRLISLKWIFIVNCRTHNAVVFEILFANELCVHVVIAFSTESGRDTLFILVSSSG